MASAKKGIVDRNTGVPGDAVCFLDDDGSTRFRTIQELFDEEVRVEWLSSVHASLRVGIPTAADLEESYTYADKIVEAYRARFDPSRKRK